MSQVLTGARGIVKIKDKVVGFIGGVNVTVEQTLTDVDVMGQLDVGDLAETAHKCNFSINYFKALTDEGVTSNKGEFIPNTASAIGLDTTETDFKAMRAQTYFNVEILDDQTGSSVFKMENCKWEGGSGQMDARGLWQGTWNFRALRGFGL